MILKIALPALILTLPPASFAARVGGHASPYYFADDSDEAAAPRPTRAEKAGKKKSAKPAPGRRETLELATLRFLPPGNYEGTIEGILCNSCTLSVVTELKKIKGITAASFDFEEGILRLTVKKLKKGRRVRFSKIKRAIRHAGRRVKLGTRFFLVEFRNAK